MEDDDNKSPKDPRYKRNLRGYSGNSRTNNNYTRGNSYTKSGRSNIFIITDINPPIPKRTRIPTTTPSPSSALLRSAIFKKSINSLYF